MAAMLLAKVDDESMASSSDNDNDHEDEDENEESFSSVLAPLANHFFPDGCPQANLSSVWPCSGQQQQRQQGRITRNQQQQQPRRPTSAREAQQALERLREWSKQHGLTMLQVSAVSVVACSFATANNNNSAASAAVKIQSSLTATTATFQSLLRCMIFNKKNDDNDVISPDVVCRLVSILNVPELDDKGRCDVLRFFTLLVWWQPQQAANNNIPTVLERFYAVLFAQVLRPATCVDAVRLLWHLTRPKHATRHRLQRLQQHLNQRLLVDGHSTAATTSSSGVRLNSPTTTSGRKKTKQTKTSHQHSHHQQQQQQALTALLQLYHDYQRSNNNNNNTIDTQQQRKMKNGLHHHYSTISSSETNSSSSHVVYDSSSFWFSFPDKDWENDFFRVYHSSSSSQQQQQASKRRRVGRLHRLTRIPLNYYSNYHSNNNSSDDDRGAMFLVAGSTTSSTIINDLSHRLALLHPSDAERVRLGHNLPYLLRETWYHHPTAAMSQQQQQQQQAPTELFSSRLRLLTALAALAVQADGLPHEAQDFVWTEIIPTYSWDGGSSSLTDIIAHTNCCLFDELHSRVLIHMERLFLVADAKVQQKFVGEALARLVHRWASLDWTTTTTTTDDSTSNRSYSLADKIKTLRRLIQWTDQLLLRAFLSLSSWSINNSGPDHHHYFSLSAVTLDFFTAVCDLTTTTTTTTIDCDFFLPAPSPRLVYRLLLHSNNAASVDRLCQLLVSFKTMYQRLKDNNNNKPAVELSNENVEGKEEEHIRVFNGYIWDLCCVLWRCSPPPSPPAAPSLDDNAVHINSSGNNDNRSLLYSTLCMRPQTQLQLHNAAAVGANPSCTIERSSNMLLLSKALSITHGAIFASYALNFLKERFPSNNDNNQFVPLSPNRIRGKLKVQYLDYLKERGMLTGLHAFLSTFVGSLATNANTR